MFLKAFSGGGNALLQRFMQDASASKRPRLTAVASTPAQELSLDEIRPSETAADGSVLEDLMPLDPHLNTWMDDLLNFPTSTPAPQPSGTLPLLAPLPVSVASLPEDASTGDDPVAADVVATAATSNTTLPPPPPSTH